MNITVTLTGTAQTKAQLRLAEQGAATANTARGVVASTVTYAPYVEYGTRTMKGRDFLGRAVGQINHDAFAAALGEAMWQGPSAVRRLFNVAVFGILSRAQALVPVRTGRLRGSLYGKVESR